MDSLEIVLLRSNCVEAISVYFPTKQAFLVFFEVKARLDTRTSNPFTDLLFSPVIRF